MSNAGIKDIISKKLKLAENLIDCLPSKLGGQLTSLRELCLDAAYEVLQERHSVKADRNAKHNDNFAIKID